VLRGIDPVTLTSLVVALPAGLRLELDTPFSTKTFRELAAHCSVVAPRVVPSSPLAVGDHVRHTGRGEWGTGRITRRRDAKVDVLFGATQRTFRADAPFLELVGQRAP
jgi:Protein of unknown function (DUF3553)